MPITALPDDCLLACLARCPYADLRNAVPSTCKQLRDAVASNAFRRTREAAGCVEYGVFATPIDESQSDCFLITESGACRTAPRPPNQACFFIVCRQDEAIVMTAHPFSRSMRAHAYNAGQNTWRELAPLVRDRDGESDDKLAGHAAVGCIGRNIVVIGGGCGENYEPFLRRMDAYDPAEDTWSRLPDLPFDCHNNRVAEVDGKLYCYGGYRGPDGENEDARRTAVYDPATRAWTDGPRLPHELWRNEVGHELVSAYEVSKRLCITGIFKLDDVRNLFSAFVWDPARGSWDDFELEIPLPPVFPRYRGVSQVDGHIALMGSISLYSHEDPPEIHEGSLRVFVLKEGSRNWTEWALPAVIQNMVQNNVEIAFRAVRIG